MIPQDLPPEVRESALATQRSAAASAQRRMMEQALAVDRHERAEQERSMMIRALHAVRAPQTVPELMTDPGGVPDLGAFPTHPWQLPRNIVFRMPRFGPIPVAGAFIRTFDAVGSRLRPNRTAVEEALRRDQIPVPEEEAFHTPEGSRTPEEGEPVAAPPLFVPPVGESLAGIGRELLPAAGGAALAAAAGASSMNPIIMGAMAGVGLSQMYRSGARTEPHVTP